MLNNAAKPLDFVFKIFSFIKKTPLSIWYLNDITTKSEKQYNKTDRKKLLDSQKVVKSNYLWYHLTKTGGRTMNSNKKEKFNS